MSAVATRADGVRVEVSGVEVLSLDAVGLVPGIEILAAAGRNGVGRGMMRTGGDGRTLSWRAPGSTAFGPDVVVAADGSVLLEDGLDFHKWLRIQIDESFMVDSPAHTVVDLRDVFNNDVGSDDVTAAQASAGLVETYTLTLKNYSPHVVTNVTCWLDSTAGGFGELELSDDGAVWVTPDSETHADAIVFASLALLATATLHVRRTIAASASSNAGVTNVIKRAWTGW